METEKRTGLSNHFGKIVDPVTGVVTHGYLTWEQADIENAAVLKSLFAACDHAREIEDGPEYQGGYH
mgnify:CR=1 FL=1